MCVSIETFVRSNPKPSCVPIQTFLRFSMYADQVRLNARQPPSLRSSSVWTYLILSGTSIGGQKELFSASTVTSNNGTNWPPTQNFDHNCHRKAEFGESENSMGAKREMPCDSLSEVNSIYEVRFQHLIFEFLNRKNIK